eukprot:101919-Chlamydomonas_euryale.AAC.1
MLPDSFLRGGSATPSLANAGVSSSGAHRCVCQTGGPGGGRVVLHQGHGHVTHEESRNVLLRW